VFEREVSVRSSIRTSFLALVSSAFLILAVAVPAASAAGGGFEKFFAGNCNAAHKTCGEGAEESPSVPKAKEEAEQQSGAFVPFGVTDFTVKKFEAAPGFFVPIENLKNLRVDVAAGVVTNPHAVPLCSTQDFTSTVIVPGTLFLKPTCPNSTAIGENIVETVLETPLKSGKFKDEKLTGKVYNLEQESGQGSTYGVALPFPPAGPGVFVHTIIKGSVEWASDYHDYFVINNIAEGLLESRLVFFGNKNPETGETTEFIRNGTKCATVGPETTTTATGEFEAGTSSSRPYTGLVGGIGCGGLEFGPSFALTPETATTDAGDGITTETKDTHPSKTAGLDTADLESITVKMPEGMTMNPSAAAALEGCDPSQAVTNSPSKAFEITVPNPVACPSGSKLGTVSLEVPTLPKGALQGSIFLGKPAGKSIETNRDTVYLDAESSRYGIRVLLEGEVEANETTGRLTVTFKKNPQAPFENVKLHFNGGMYAPIANPLSCGNTETQTAFAAFSGAALNPAAAIFTTVGCPSPSFAPTQSTSELPAVGGSTTALTFNLTRPEGQQYVRSMRTTLPPGLYGKIPTVPTQCTEAQANVGACPAGSMVGTVAALSGSGTPFPFSGPAFLTGPDQGAPYGLEFEVPTKAGPFNFGTELVHAKIEVNPNTAQVEVSASLPTIKRGVPTRIRGLTVNLNRANYILNPTNCAALKTESTLVSTLGATANISSPFQVEGCSNLPYKPSFTAKTSGKFSKANGASLETTINTPEGDANMKSVLVQLPVQLPSRLTTLNKACPEKTFAANPLSCPAGSKVGSARANTTLLPGKLQGPAYFVSHGGEAFPDLDLVLEANGIRVIIVGKTKITKGITTTDFASTPDSPVSSVTVNLPLASNSALAANGNLCTQKLVMPTTITAQNGKVFKQNTNIALVNCPVEVVGKKTVGTTAYLTVQAPEAGRVSGSGPGLTTVANHPGGPKRLTLKVPLSSSGRAHLPKTVKVRVGFFPKKKGAPTSVTFVRVRFS
jgi:hypothetical protein